jgi:hypothetical protein
MTAPTWAEVFALAQGVAFRTRTHLYVYAIRLTEGGPYHYVVSAKPRPTPEEAR